MKTNESIFKTPFGKLNSNNYSPTFIFSPFLFGIILIEYGNIFINIVLSLGAFFLYDRYFKRDSNSQYIVWLNHNYLVAHYLLLGSIFIFGLLCHYHWGWAILLLAIFLIIIVFSGVVEHQSFKKLHHDEVDFSEFEDWENNRKQ